MADIRYNRAVLMGKYVFVRRGSGDRRVLSSTIIERTQRAYDYTNLLFSWSIERNNCVMLLRYRPFGLERLLLPGNITPMQAPVSLME